MNVCSQNRFKWKSMLESHVVVFFGSLPLKILMHLLHCFTDQPITIPSWGSFLDYKFLHLTHAFLRLMTGFIELCKEKLFLLHWQSISNAKICVEQHFSVKNFLWSLNALTTYTSLSQAALLPLFYCFSLSVMKERRLFITGEVQYYGFGKSDGWGHWLIVVCLEYGSDMSYHMSAQ